MAEAELDVAVEFEHMDWKCMRAATIFISNVAYVVRIRVAYLRSDRQ